MPLTPGPAGIIVADDDPLLQAVLRSKLEALGHEVFVADDGLEAVRQASRMRAALVVLDLRMPKLNGFQACQKIRQLPEYETTPIVMLTFADGRGTRESAIRNGATAFFVKPFATAALMMALAKFLPFDDDAARLQAVITTFAGRRPWSQ